MNDTAPVIKTTGLALGYGGHSVLESVEIEVRRGEFWLLLGPNGTGKTTLLRALLGQLAPASGRIERDPELARPDRVGFVPQRCDIDPTLPTTVREFVSLGLVGIPCTAGDRRERLAWALERLGLAGKERDDYWSLSGGQRQRCLVARALVRRPRFILLDEPTAGLDLPSRDALLRAIARLTSEEQLTVIFVTHDLTAAVQFATHVALFAGGRVIAGPRETVLMTENLQRAFGDAIRFVYLAARDATIAIEEQGER